jgi:acetyl-CoA carboxylase carboxyltransferase component
MIAALVTIIAGVAGTGGAALPIVVPVAGLAVLGKLAHDLYKASWVVPVLSFITGAKMTMDFF